MATKIIIIDDNQTHLVLSVGLFGRVFEDVPVLSFDNALNALNEIKQDPDSQYVIFLDLYMPIMDGWEFLEEYQKLRRKESDSIFMLSAASDLTAIGRARSHPMLDGFVSKPMTFHALTSIKKHLHKTATV